MSSLWSRDEPVDNMRKRTFLIQKLIRQKILSAKAQSRGFSQLREEMDIPQHIDISDLSNDAINQSSDTLDRFSFRELGPDGIMRISQGIPASSDCSSPPLPEPDPVDLISQGSPALQPSDASFVPGELVLSNLVLCDGEEGTEPVDHDPVRTLQREQEQAGFSPGCVVEETPDSQGPPITVEKEMNLNEFDPVVVSQRILGASLLVRNALQTLDPSLLDRMIGEDEKHRSETKLRRYIIVHSRAYSIFLGFIIFLHLAMAFLEPFSPIQDAPLAVPLSLLVSLVFSCIYLADFFVRYSYHRRKEFWTLWTITRLALISLNVLESVTLLILLLTHTPIFIVSRFWRPFYVIERSSSLRLIVESTLRSARNCLSTFFIIFCIVFFYAYLGFIIFSQTREGQLYFGTIGDSLTNMFVLLTTANFPDIMMPAYAEHGAWCIFFISYLVICLFFLIHLVTATFYNSFTELASEDTLAQLEIRRQSLELAFQLLDYDETGYLCYFQWSELYMALHPRAKPDHIQLTFRMVDSDKSNNITLDEFLQVCEFLDLEFYSKRIHQGGSDTIMSIRKRILSIFRHRYVVLARQLFLLANCLFLIIETSGCAPGQENSTWECPTWDFIAFAVAIYFVLEQALMLFAYRSNFYTACRIIDLGLVLVMVSSQTVAIVINRLTPDQNRLLLLPRIFIILRLFVNFSHTRRITKALLRICNPIFRYLVVLFCLYYTFAVLGVELFQDYIDPTNKNPILIGTLYDLSGFWPNNFNTLPKAFVVLYQLMVVNNFFVTMDAYTLVTNKWARIYFISFICISVYIFLNLFIGFIIQAFLRSFEGIQHRKSFNANLQLKIDAASEGVAFEVPNRRWFARFKPSLLDYYLDIFHLENSLVLRPTPSTEEASNAPELVTTSSEDPPQEYVDNPLP